MHNIEHSETIDRVTYELRIEEEDVPVRGNAMASGDDDLDRKYEDEILDRLDRGDLWAWCQVTVTAKITVEDQRFEGWDALGGCSYRNVEEFIQPGGYWEDMRHQALLDLASNLERAVARGKIAQSALEAINLGAPVKN